MLRRILGKNRFRGGPDLEHSYSVGLNLGGAVMNIALPLGGDPPHCPFPVDESGYHYIPIDNSAWFEANKVEHAKHCFIDTKAGIGWAYGKGIWPPVAMGPLGSISCYVHINRSKKGYELSSDNWETLKRSIYMDYKNFFEDPVPGNYLRGHNIKIIQEAKEWAYSPHRSKEQIEDMFSHYIRSQSMKYPEEFNIFKTSNHDWLFYTEKNGDTRYYCLPIDKEYYLVIRFLHQDWLSGFRHYWQEHANKTEQKIMESVQLISPDTLHCDYIPAHQ